MRSRTVTLASHLLQDASATAQHLWFSAAPSEPSAVLRAPLLRFITPFAPHLPASLRKAAWQKVSAPLALADPSAPVRAAAVDLATELFLASSSSDGLSMCSLEEWAALLSTKLLDKSDMVRAGAMEAAALLDWTALRHEAPEAAVRLATTSFAIARALPHPSTWSCALLVSVHAAFFPLQLSPTSAASPASSSPLLPGVRLHLLLHAPAPAVPARKSGSVSSSMLPPLATHGNILQAPTSPSACLLVFAPSPRPAPLPTATSSFASTLAQDWRGALASAEQAAFDLGWDASNYTDGAATAHGVEALLLASVLPHMCVPFRPREP